MSSVWAISAFAIRDPGIVMTTGSPFSRAAPRPASYCLSVALLLFAGRDVTLYCYIRRKPGGLFGSDCLSAFHKLFFRRRETT